MRVMAISAHPDDIEMFCAGTLAKYHKAGHKVGIAILTNGEVGSPTLSKEEIAAIREKESRKAAAIIDADFYWGGYPDEFLFNTPETRLRVIEIIRQFRPDLILGLDKDHDYHPDHTTAGQLVWDTHVMVTVPNIKTASPPAERIPNIYFTETAGGVNFLPEIFVDITDCWEVKKAMLECHQSQQIWTQAQYDCSLTGMAETICKFRGFQAGCKYAEGFRRPKFFPWATDKNGLLP